MQKQNIEKTGSLRSSYSDAGNSTNHQTNAISDTIKNTNAKFLNSNINWVYADGVTSNPVTQAIFYRRTHQVGYERAYFSMVNGHASVDLNPGEKIGVTIDNVFYAESDVKKLPADKPLILTVHKSKADKVTINNVNYYVPFAFYSMKLKIYGQEADTVKIGNNIVLKKNKSGVITPNENKMIMDRATEPGGPFYERFTIHPNDNRRYDAVILKLANGRSATATLKSDQKLGAIIDGKIHDEEMLKELPEKMIAGLDFDTLVSQNIPIGYQALYAFKTTKSK